MVKMEQVQAGLTAFIDRDVIPSLSGWDKVLVGGGAGILSARLPSILAQYVNHPIVSALGLYDPEKNMVDIDAVHKAAMPYIGADSLPVKIPFVGLTIKIGKPEIDLLYKYIKEA